MFEAFVQCFRKVWRLGWFGRITSLFSDICYLGMEKLYRNGIPSIKFLQNATIKYLFIFSYSQIHSIPKHRCNICWGVPANFHRSLNFVKDFHQLSARNYHIRLPTCAYSIPRANAVYRIWVQNNYLGKMRLLSMIAHFFILLDGKTVQLPTFWQSIRLGNTHLPSWTLWTLVKHLLNKFGPAQNRFWK